MEELETLKKPLLHLLEAMEALVEILGLEIQLYELEAVAVLLATEELVEQEVQVEAEAELFIIHLLHHLVQLDPELLIQAVAEELVEDPLVLLIFYTEELEAQEL